MPDASDANTGATADAVRFLRRAAAYGPDVQRVDVIETHMSWVFLTETRVYKLKKPVRLPYLDYSTVDARRRYCELELQLNRRLAASVYLRVVPLARERGQLAIGARGDVVDWLVEMRRLPADRMLDEQIRRHAVSESEVRQAAALLASFYQRAVPAGWTGHDYRRRLAATLAATRRALARPCYRLSATTLDAAVSGLVDALSVRSALFDARARRVVDAHGDLRPEHICLEPQPVIIDCLEFDRELRLLDPISELSFLALECERHGAARIGTWVFETYARITDDAPERSLIDFYQRYHALVRALVAARHLDDATIGDHRRWRGKARDYLEIAAG